MNADGSASDAQEASKPPEAAKTPQPLRRRRGSLSRAIEAGDSQPNGGSDPAIHLAVPGGDSGLLVRVDSSPSTSPRGIPAAIPTPSPNTTRRRRGSLSRGSAGPDEVAAAAAALAAFNSASASSGSSPDALHHGGPGLAGTVQAGMRAASGGLGGMAASLGLAVPHELSAQSSSEASRSPSASPNTSFRRRRGSLRTNSAAAGSPAPTPTGGLGTLGAGVGPQDLAAMMNDPVLAAALAALEAEQGAAALLPSPCTSAHAPGRSFFRDSSPQEGISGASSAPPTASRRRRGSSAPRPAPPPPQPPPPPRRPAEGEGSGPRGCLGTPVNAEEAAVAEAMAMAAVSSRKNSLSSGSPVSSRKSSLAPDHLASLAAAASAAASSSPAAGLLSFLNAAPPSAAVPTPLLALQPPSPVARHAGPSPFAFLHAALPAAASASSSHAPSHSLDVPGPAGAPQTPPEAPEQTASGRFDPKELRLFAAAAQAAGYRSAVAAGGEPVCEEAEEEVEYERDAASERAREIVDEIADEMGGKLSHPLVAFLVQRGITPDTVLHMAVDEALIPAASELLDTATVSVLWFHSSLRAEFSSLPDPVHIAFSPPLFADCRCACTPAARRSRDLDCAHKVAALLHCFSKPDEVLDYRELKRALDQMDAEELRSTLLKMVTMQERPLFTLISMLEKLQEGAGVLEALPAAPAAPDPAPAPEPEPEPAPRIGLALNASPGGAPAGRSPGLGPRRPPRSFDVLKRSPYGGPRPGGFLPAISIEEESPRGTPPPLVLDGDREALGVPEPWSRRPSFTRPSSFSTLEDLRTSRSPSPSPTSRSGSRTPSSAPRRPADPRRGRGLRANNSRSASLGGGEEEEEEAAADREQRHAAAAVAATRLPRSRTLDSPRRSSLPSLTDAAPSEAPPPSAASPSRIRPGSVQI
eukprot:tig00021127_g18823.t1